MRVPIEPEKGTDAMAVTYMFQSPQPVRKDAPCATGAADAAGCGDATTAGAGAARAAVNGTVGMTAGRPFDRSGTRGGLLPDLTGTSAQTSDRCAGTGGQEAAKPATAPDTPAAASDTFDTRAGTTTGFQAEPAGHPAPAVQMHNLPVKWAPSNSRLILVARSRGGMGATSVAANLAIELLNHRGVFATAPRRQVALVDLDVQFGTAASLLDLEDRGGLLALARLPEEPDIQAVRNALSVHPCGLKVLPAPRKAIPLDAFDGPRVASIIDGLMAEHDYVVVDLPPALVYWLEPLLKRADRLLMVTDLAVPSVASARRIIDLMREDNAELVVDVVVSREQKPLFQRRLHRDAADALGEPLGHWLPDETRLSRQALDRGEPLVSLSPRCPWSRAVRKLARKIEAAAAMPRKSRESDR